MKIFNKKAGFNYELLDKLEAGIVLTGAEVKALRRRGADINQSYVRIKDKEAYLVNANFPLDIQSGTDSSKTRKLLLNKKEIISILSKIKGKRLTIVPTKIYTKGHLIKVEVALARPKRQFQKKELLRRADLDREAQRELRGSKSDFQKDSRR
jgi:SsrA-binding protein